MPKIQSRFVHSVKGTILAFSAILLLFNFFAGIVGAIWLLCIGEWRIVVAGILASFTMPWWWLVVSLPTLALFPLLVFFSNKKNVLGMAIFAFLADLYNSVLMTAWIATVFFFAVDLIFWSDVSLIPMLLFAYSVATSPFLYMASKEPPDNFATSYSVLTIVIGSFLIVLLFLIGLPLIYPLIILCSLMLLKTIFITVVSVMLDIEPRSDIDHNYGRCSEERDTLGPLQGYHYND